MILTKGADAPDGGDSASLDPAPASLLKMRAA